MKLGKILDKIYFLGYFHFLYILSHPGVILGVLLIPGYTYPPRGGTPPLPIPGGRGVKVRYAITGDCFNKVCLPRAVK